jgi:hypothetical protein
MSNHEVPGEFSDCGWEHVTPTLNWKSDKLDFDEASIEPTIRVFNDFVKSHSGAGDVAEGFLSNMEYDEKEQTFFTSDWAINSSPRLVPVDRVTFQSIQFGDEYGKNIEGKFSHSLKFYISDIFVFAIAYDPDSSYIMLETLADEGNEVKISLEKVDTMVAMLKELETDGLLVEMAEGHYIQL